jgi:hypothetical protein
MSALEGKREDFEANSPSESEVFYRASYGKLFLEEQNQKIYIWIILPLNS